MKKESRDSQKLERTIERVQLDLSSLDATSDLVRTEETAGIIRFTSYAQKPNTTERNLASKTDVEFALPWQTLSELDSDHGIFMTHDVLSSAGLKDPYSTKSLNGRMEEEIRSEVPKKYWTSISRELKKQRQHGADEATVSTILAAIWADVFCERYNSVWLAAMANHAYYILQDDYAFGYLTALLDQKLTNENDALRGKKTVASAREGGKSRATRNSLRTGKILKAMRNHIESGHSIANASRLACNEGFGVSKEANRKLWSRHSKSKI